MATSPTKRPSGEPDTDELIDRVLGGDAEAWGDLVARVHPKVVRLCKRRAGARRRGDDSAHDVAASVVERLEREDFAALRHYVRAREKYAESSFDRWLSTVVSNSYIDWVRRQPGAQRVRAAGGGREMETVDVVSLTDASASVGHAPDVARVVEVRRILERLASAGYPPDQRRALLIWLRGGNAADVADELGLAGAADGTRLLHAARTRLRRLVDKGSN